MAKRKNEITIRSSAAEYLTYAASVGDQQDSTEMRYEDENIWLTQKMMATLYGFFSNGDGGTGDSYAGISVEQKRRIDSGVPENRVVNSRLISIVEEPEQNLYPRVRAGVLYYLLGTLKKEDNFLVITTHSPYLLSCLTLSA